VAFFADFRVKSTKVIDPTLPWRVRLMLRNLVSSTVPTLILAPLLAWSVATPSNARAVWLWCAAVVGYKLLCTWDARRVLSQTQDAVRAQRLMPWLIATNALTTTLWGLLAWVGLDGASAEQHAVVIAFQAGIGGSIMAVLAPVLPVFAVGIGCLVITVVLKLIQLGDSSLVMAAVALLYVAALGGQARNAHKMVRRAIELRFRNDELLDQLQIEKAAAEAARKSAEQSSAAKSKFLAAASHDLRQPVHAQGMFLEVLSRSELTSAQREVLSHANAASRSAADLLDTLLDFSRISAGVVEAQPRPFPLQPLLHKLEAEFGPQANAHGLVYRTHETHLSVTSDPALVEVIVRNLVSNAVRYTRSGGVLVAARKRGESVVVEVWDTGVGIEADQHGAIFQEFHQIGNPERDRDKGLGLGLAIGQGLASTLGHTLSLRSRVGRGSVFRLSLPIANDFEVPVGSAPTTAGDADAAGAPSAESKDGAYGLIGCEVLVIDDDASVRLATVRLLEGWGCRCRSAGCAEEALAEAARGQPPDLVISDYRLRDGRTGTEAILRLRSALKSALPALLITGDTDPQRLRAAQASGIPLLHKPVSPSELGSHLQAQWRGARGEGTVKPAGAGR